MDNSECAGPTHRGVALPQELAGYVTWLLAADTHAVIAVVGCRLAEIGLSIRDFAVLASAAERVALTQRELANKVGLDKTTLVATLDVLETKALLRRASAPRDRRARTIELTAAGERALKRGRELVLAGETTALAGLSENEREQLQTLLTGLGENLRAVANTGSCV
jgi:DNA-binding MarR family transcriptional regulator